MGETKVTMNNIEKIIGKFNGLEERQIFQFAGMLTDPLTRRILAKLASPQSPISVDSVPTSKLGADKGAVISRLSKLENVGLLSSEKVKAENGFCKKYFINENGKSLVSNYMKKESRQFT